MVKRWIVMVVIMIALGVGCFLENRYINKSFNWLINSLESLQIELTENQEKIDTEKLIDDAYSIHEEWHEKVIVLKCLIWHTWVKDIELSLAKIAVYVEENDFTEAYAELASLVDYCAHYSDDFKISLENVF